MLVLTRSRSLRHMAGAALAIMMFTGAGVGLAAAQSAAAGGAAGSVQAPGDTAALSAAATSPPQGKPMNLLPMATGDVLRALEESKPASTSGKPGVSSASSGNLSTPEAFGGATAPYSTGRAAVQALGTSTSALVTPVSSFPYRATGRLYMVPRPGYIGWCSASMVKPGVVVTAAHCVFNYGLRANGWYRNFVFCPANTGNRTGPYGCFNATGARIPSPYYNGNDTCSQRGVVCNNDIATLVVSRTVGQRVGYYAYGWNNYSFVNSAFLGNITAGEITQLGYPTAFDGGLQMQRTDAVARYFQNGNLRVIEMGSAQTGGSSGGPWLVNFNTVPSVGSGASLGSAPNRAVVGVTSYGSTTVGYNRQGASFFGQNAQFPSSNYGGYGAGNIGLLMRDTCTANPSAC